MRPWRWLWVATLVAGASLRADNIFQTTAQGKQEVIQRDAILVKEDSEYIYYKHFDLKDRRVEKVNLSKSSLPFVVVPSSPAERKQIVDYWKRFGYKVTITDLSGKTRQVYDAYLDFYPPGGRGSLLESVPPRTAFPILLSGGGADEVEFSRIAAVSFQGQQVKITLRTGEMETGKFLMPTDKPAEARLLGITDQYNPTSEDVFDFASPLDHIKSIEFE